MKWLGFQHTRQPTAKNVQPYMSHAKNPVTLAIHGNTVAALWKNGTKKKQQPTNKNIHMMFAALYNYKKPMMFVSPSHTRPGLKMRKNHPDRGALGGVGCLALPPSSSESMKSNMFEALKRANVFHCSCCWHVLASGVRFLLEVQVSGGISK